MLSIRLTRVGKKKQPMYRLTVMEKARDPWGRAIEILGTINPHTDPRTVILKKERIQYWISKGANMTDTVWNLFVDEKIVEGEKRSTVHLSKKRRGKIEEKTQSAKEAAAVKEEAPAKEAPAPVAEEVKAEEAAPIEEAKEEVVEENS